jgi:hypothetical protein
MQDGATPGLTPFFVQRFATIAAAHQMVNRTRKLNSELAGHWSSFKLHAQLRKEEINSLRTDPFALPHIRIAIASCSERFAIFQTILSLYSRRGTIEIGSDAAYVDKAGVI